ncbi:uncharacterized protein A4U43_C05F10720 [Asparagus officinalis]|uniref:Uncharacterized protein n=1 Tax=Asparagus officinalis TaxID=4686 RepID=A0A5P1EW67_ASPOF|nr:uncharacterized protein A4U43_C05F10720 [Asparagus officinalis]
MGLENRGVVGDKWPRRILWVCAIGSAISMFFVAVEKQAQNRQRMMAEDLKGLDGQSSGEIVVTLMLLLGTLGYGGSLFNVLSPAKCIEVLYKSWL